MKKIALSVSVILMALCLVISCESTPNLTVSFDTDGGSTIAPVSVAPGKTVAEPEPPTKTGYQFVEWQLEGVKFNFDTVIEENITLKALWKPVFTVTFDTDGGSEIEPVTVTEGKIADEPDTPVRKGYDFIGWQLNGKSYDFKTAISENITLKAIWERDEGIWDGKEADTEWYSDASSSFNLSKASELAGLSKLVANGKIFKDKTITLDKDLDLGDYDWMPIGNVNAVFGGTFDGNNHTIKNLKVDTSANTGAEYASGLFGWGYTDAHFKNLTIDGADVKGHHYVAAVVGYIYGSISNCHVKNATIINTHANDGACGDKTGAIVGYYPTENKAMDGCSASDCSISGSRDAGQLAGAIGNTKITNCTATRVEVSRVKDDSCTDNYAGWNIQNALYGRDLEKEKEDGVRPSEESGI